jgi:hypothetical protein
MEARIIKHRRVFAAVVAAIVVGGATPLTASANPILSGYGGPGQGSQVILGSALVNGSGGGGGAGGSQASATGGSLTSIASALAAPTGAASPRRPRSATARRSTRGRAAGRSAPERVKRNASGADIVSRSTRQPLLGISQTALVGIVVAVGALLLLGLLTRRLARTDAETRPSKARASTHRSNG